jgi:hypothetical protein
MNSNEPFERDQQLSKLLSKWRVNAALPPRFQEQVWERIDNADRQSSSVWMSIWNLMTIEAARPTFAVAYVALLISVGVIAGGNRGHSKAEHVKSDMQLRYIQMVDPYQTPR